MLLSKLSKYGHKAGQLGSSLRDQPVDVSEVSALLSKPRSQLEEMWKRDNIHEWTASLGKPLPAYEPSEYVRNATRSTYVPGEKCVPCKKKNAR